MTQERSTATQQLPTFAEIADARCQEARCGTRTVTLKFAIDTARMMVEVEHRREQERRWLIALAKEWAARPEGGSARVLLRQIEEGR